MLLSHVNMNDGLGIALYKCNDTDNGVLPTFGSYGFLDTNLTGTPTPTNTTESLTHYELWHRI